MRKIPSIIFLLVGVLGLFSCSQQNPNPIIGKWVLKEIQKKSQQKQTIDHDKYWIVLKESGDYITSFEKGKWQIEEKKLITISEEGKKAEATIFEMSSKVLYLSVQDQGEETIGIFYKEE